MGNDPKLSISIESLLRRPVPVESRHINLRLSGVDAYQYLESQTSGITDSFRIRECQRIVAILFSMREKNTPVKIPGGSLEDVIEYLGAFEPQRPMDTRKRKPRT